MPRKKDQDSTPGAKLLRLFRRLMLDGRKHYQGELASWLNCSPQTVIRLTQEIESIIGQSLATGMENHRRWYQMKSTSGLANIGSEFEEVRYLALSKDLASQMLSRDVLERIDESVFNLSLRLIEEYSSIIDADKRPEYFFHIGGIVDYHPHKDTLDKLVLAQQKRLVSFIKYRTTSSAYEDTREVVFAPGRIISRANTLYVLGAALADENDTYTFKYWTHLAVHRILLLSITNAVFDFDVTLPDSSVFGFPHVEPKTYRIRFLPGAHADYVRERIWAEEQSIEEEEDGGLILTVTVATESEIMNWVKSFGEHCQLLGPVAPV